MSHSRPAVSRLVENFLHLVEIDTQSDLFSKDHPSTPGQLDAIQWIQEKMEELGYECERFAHGTLVVHIPGSGAMQGWRPVAWAAHIDTAPSGGGKVNPRIVKYTGGGIALPHGDVKIPVDSPSLQKLAASGGGYVITSDGTSLLGADDKAGAAAIMELAYRLVERKLGHPPLHLFFCTDEEIGRFGEDLPGELLNALRVFWTVDGTTLGTLDTNCLRLCRRRLTFSSQPKSFRCRKTAAISFLGKSGHPGVSPELWKPAHLAACDVVSSYFRKVRVSSPAASAGVQVLEGNASEAEVKLGVNDTALLEETIERVLPFHPQIRHEIQTRDADTRIDHSPHLLAVAEFGRTLYYAVPPQTHRGPSGKGMIVPRVIARQDDRTVVTAIAGETKLENSERMNAVLDGFIERTRQLLPQGVSMRVDEKIVCSNIGDVIQAHREVLDPLLGAMDEMGIPVDERTVSGGTDGGMLNLKYTDLPCPNIGTGAAMLHCEQEHISVQDLESLADLLVRTTASYAG